jgi:hypothetical protein
MRKIELRELLAIEVDVRPAVDLGDGGRSVSFSGGRLSGGDGPVGRVLEGGVDWHEPDRTACWRSTPITSSSPTPKK